MVKISTSQFKYDGPDRYDITYKAKTAFSPTKDLVYSFKYKGLSPINYTNQYISLMSKSYNCNRQEWDRILNMNTVVFVCYCNPNSFCHRFILARLFEKLGAEYCGEIILF